MMRDSFFLDGAFQDDVAQGDAFDVSFGNLLEAQTEVFSELVKAVGLDPAVDLRYLNLDGIDLNGSDVRGFDFTGASMKGVNWNGCRRDDTTILNDIDTGDEEIIEAVIDEVEWAHLNTLKTLGPNEQVLWLYNIRRSDWDFHSKLTAAYGTFLSTDNDFVARNALRVYIQALDIGRGLYILKQSIDCSEYHSRRAKMAFEVLDILILKARNRVLRFAAEYLNTPHFFNAALFLARHLDIASVAIIKNLSDMVRKRCGDIDQAIYLNELAMRFGEPFLQSLRDPLSGDMLLFNTSVDLVTLERITRRIVGKITTLTLGEQENLKEYRKLYGSGRSFEFIREKVHANLRKMNSYGAHYHLEFENSLP